MLNKITRFFQKKSSAPRITSDSFNPDDWVLPSEVKQAIKNQFIKSIKKTATKHPNMTIGCLCGQCVGRLTISEYYREVLNQTHLGEEDTNQYIRAQKNIYYINGKSLEDLISDYGGSKPSLPQNDANIT